MRVRRKERRRRKWKHLMTHMHTQRERERQTWGKCCERKEKRQKMTASRKQETQVLGECVPVYIANTTSHRKRHLCLQFLCSPLSLSLFTLLVGGPLLHLAQVTPLHTTWSFFSSSVRVDERTGTLKASSIKDALSVRIIKTNLFALLVVVFHFLLTPVNTWLYDHHWSSHSLTVHSYCKCC